MMQYYHLSILISLIMIAIIKNVNIFLLNILVKK